MTQLACETRVFAGISMLLWLVVTYNVDLDHDVQRT
jgi:hypothetical protein